MSLTVLVIAAFHAAPVFLFGSKSSGGATLTAIAMCIVAVSTGGPQYIFFDLGAIALAWWIVVQSVTVTEPNKEHVESRKDQNSAQSSDSWLWILILGVVGGGLALSDKTIDSSKPPKSEIKTSKVASPGAPTISKSTDSKHSKVKQQRPSHDLRTCLESGSNSSIARCVNNSR